MRYRGAAVGYILSMAMRAMSYGIKDHLSRLFDRQGLALPQGVVDVTTMGQRDFDLLVSVEAKKTGLNPYAERMLEIRTQYAAVAKAITQQLKAIPHLRDLLLLLVRDYTSQSQLRNYLLDPKLRRIVLETIAQMQTFTTPLQVRQREHSLKDVSGTLFHPMTCPQLLDAFLAKRLLAGHPIYRLSAQVLPQAQLQHALSAYLGGEAQQAIADIDDFMEAFLQDVITPYNEDRFILRDFSRSRVKDVSGIMSKAERYATLAEMTDIFGYRLVVEQYTDVERTVRLLQDYFGECVLEVQNKCIPGDVSNPYRAVHLVIRFDAAHCFELQVKTLPQFIIGELDHEFLYAKNSTRYNVPKPYTQIITQLLWGVHDSLARIYGAVRANLQQSAAPNDR